MRLAVALFVVIAACSPTGAMAVGWTAPEPIPGAAGGSVETVVARPDGSVIVVWVEQTANEMAELYAVVRSANGSFGAPQLLDTVTADVFAGLSGVAAAADRDGNVVMTWSQYRLGPGMTSDGDVHWIRLPAGSATFGSPETFGDNAGGSVFAMGPSGDARLIWNEEGAARTAFLPSGAAAFGEAENLLAGYPDDHYASAVTVDAAGHSRVLFATVSGAQSLHAVRLSRSGGRSTPEVLVPAGDNLFGFVFPALAVTPDGRSGVAVTTLDVDGFPPGPWSTEGRLLTAFAAPGEDFGDMTQLGPTEMNSNAGGSSLGNPALVFDRDGASRLAVTRTHSSEPATVLTSAGRDAFGPLLTNHSTSAQLFGTTLAAAGESAALLLQDTDAGMLAAATNDGGFTPLAPVFGTGAGGAVTAPVGSDLVVAWTRVEEDDDLVPELAFYDATAPALDIAVPESATRGQSVTMTAAVGGDRFADIGKVTWDLGDGTTAEGASVAHAFPAAGVYVVKATVADANGNSRTVRRHISVVAPALPSGPPAADTTAPTITGLALTNATFRVGKAATAVIAGNKKVPFGTTVSIATSEAGIVAFEISRLVRGATRNGACVAKAKARKGSRRCVARVGAGLIQRNIGGTPLALAFSGRVNRTPLKPGPYVLRGIAADAAGNRSAAKTVVFRIVE